MATADVDLVIASEQVDECVNALVAHAFVEERFPWSVNLKGRSKVSIQIGTEDFYKDFPSQAVPADVLGILMRVASLKDTLKGKIKAWSEPTRRASKRQKDLTDMRLIEAHPELSTDVPEKILARFDF